MISRSLKKHIEKELIKVFPQFSINKIEKINLGLSESKIYKISMKPQKKLIVKIFPSYYQKRIEREAEILKHVENTIIPAPKLFHINYKFTKKAGMLVEEYIEGRNLLELIKKNKLDYEKIILSRVGGVLAELHKLPKADVWQNPDQKVYSNQDWIERLVKRKDRNLKDLKEKGVVNNEKLFRIEKYLLDFINKLKKSKIYICPLHYDYSPQNILINERTKKVSSILDFELHRIGHNLNDLGIALYWYNFYEREDLFKYLLQGYKRKYNNNIYKEVIEGYFIMQIVGALSFLSKNKNLNCEAFSKLKEILQGFF